MRRNVFFWTVLGCLLSLAMWPDAQVQRRTIDARDGDIILLPTDATITLARGTPGHVKITSHEAGRVLVVMLDEGPKPDGVVDMFHRFDLPAPFPEQYVWEGPGTIEEFESVGKQRGIGSTGVVIPKGRIYFASGSPAASKLPVPEHIAIVRYTGSSSGRVRGSYAEIEEQALTGRSGTGIRSQVALGVMGNPAGGVKGVPSPPPDGPIRVGVGGTTLVKVKDVPPVLPQAARRAGVQGTVVLEVTIDEIGRVADARILRSIPLLDQPALDAVRQWEYSPVLVQGVPRRMIATVTVTFEPR
jgi:TonB family protein